MKRIVLIIALASSITAFGQTQFGKKIERKGFVIGAGLGAGGITVSNSTSETEFDITSNGISFPNLKIGWMVNPRLAILATASGMNYEMDGKDRSFDAFMPSVQYWVHDKWWINGAAGLSVDIPAFHEDNVKEDDVNLGCAVGVSTGYEFYQGQKFAIDLQTKLTLGRVFMDNNATRDAASFMLGVGFNWY